MESTFFSEGKYIKGSSFKTSEGTEELFLILNSNEKTFFSHELDDLYDKYMIVMEKYGLNMNLIMDSMNLFMTEENKADQEQAPCAPMQPEEV